MSTRACRWQRIIYSPKMGILRERLNKVTNPVVIAPHSQLLGRRGRHFGRGNKLRRNLSQIGALLLANWAECFCCSLFSRLAHPWAIGGQPAVCSGCEPGDERRGLNGRN